MSETINTDYPSENQTRCINMGYGGYCYIDWRTDIPLIQRSHRKIESDDPTANTEDDIESAPPTIEDDNRNVVFITGGNISIAHNRPTESLYKSPRNFAPVAQILLGTGTAQITGSVSFDMSHNNLDYFLDQDKLTRNTYFHIVMNDGNNVSWPLYDNVWNSFTISAAAGGIVNCNIGYMSLNCFKEQIEPLTTTSSINLTNFFDSALVAYWQSGAEGYIQSFQINLSQDVTPVYLNNDLIMPSYLRCGVLKTTATIQSCISWQNISSFEEGGDFSFYIGMKTFTFKNAFVSTKEYSHSGAGDVAKYSYSVESFAKYPNAKIFEISPKSLS